LSNYVEINRRKKILLEQGQEMLALEVWGQSMHDAQLPFDLSPHPREILQ
jgi:hypothetical protein